MEDLPTPDTPAAGDDTKPAEFSDEKNLVVSFIQFLRHILTQNRCSPEEVEGIEVAIQCLEAAFQIKDGNYQFQPSKPLLDLFVAAEGLSMGADVLPKPTEAEIRQANTLKEEGNALMKSAQYNAAVAKYNEAIKLNRDPAYFCNRAAAYCRLEQYDLAIQDCRTALSIDPKYSKAYGRMGLALSCQNRYEQAVEAYKKAVELDPNQETYKYNLKLAEDKLKELHDSLRQNPQANMFGSSQMPDMSALLNNPAMVNMATQLMSDPNIQNLMSQMMSGLIGSGGSGTGGVANIIEAGQHLAQQMQNANPDLVEQLRRQFQGSGPAPPGDQQRPNNPGDGGSDGSQPPESK